MLETPGGYDRRRLARALEVSLATLLSVRAPVGARLKPAAERTVLDYGVLETESMSPADPNDLRIIAEDVTEAIRAFEPRLEQPVVRVNKDPDRGNRVGATISGRMRMGNRLEPFEFITPIGQGSDTSRHG